MTVLIYHLQWFDEYFWPRVQDGDSIAYAAIEAQADVLEEYDPEIYGYYQYLNPNGEIAYPLVHGELNLTLK